MTQPKVVSIACVLNTLVFLLTVPCSAQDRKLDVMGLRTGMEAKEALAFFVQKFPQCKSTQFRDLRADQINHFNKDALILAQCQIDQNTNVSFSVTPYLNKKLVFQIRAEFISPATRRQAEQSIVQQYGLEQLEARRGLGFYKIGVEWNLTPSIVLAFDGAAERYTLTLRDTDLIARDDAAFRTAHPIPPTAPRF